MTTPTPLEPCVSRSTTGLTHSAHSRVSSSAERYQLDEFDGRPILLDKHRDKLRKSSQKELCQWLDKDENLRVTTKPIARLQPFVEVKRHDLYAADEKERYRNLPGYDTTVASIGVYTEYWSRLFLGLFDRLYIIWPESSPSSVSSDRDSRCTNPAPTCGRASWSHEDVACCGAERQPPAAPSPESTPSSFYSDCDSRCTSPALTSGRASWTSEEDACCGAEREPPAAPSL